jgi:hypothetical protein
MLRKKLFPKTPWPGMGFRKRFLIAPTSETIQVVHRADQQRQLLPNILRGRHVRTIKRKAGARQPVLGVKSLLEIFA